MEADRQKQAELDELFTQRSALNAQMRSIEAKIQSFGKVSQLLAESLPNTYSIGRMTRKNLSLATLLLQKLSLS
jgi:hypothetical protein